MQIGIPGPVPDGLTIFETMRMEPDGSVPLWPLHLARLRRGCAAVGFALDEGAIDFAGLPRGEVLRLRIAIDAQGRVERTHAVQPPNPDAWQVVLRGRLDSSDPWLQIKSSRRDVYDAARAAMPEGADEVILRNERGEICEGSITSLFMRKNGRMLTPPLSSGLLPGVLRQSLLDAGRAEEKVLHPADLDWGELFMGNALRGLIPARLVP